MNEVATGRGAWNSKGLGGTLKSSKKHGTTAGPYYMLASDPNQTVGLVAYLLKVDNQPVPQEFLAVHHGVIGIQALCNSLLAAHPSRHARLDGLFDANTSHTVKAAQSMLGVKPDGIAGKVTMARLIRPVVERKCYGSAVPWSLIMSLMGNESAFDPGAIGSLDPNDWGLGQINSLANPHVSFSDAMCPSFAIQYMVNRFKIAVSQLGTQNDAIASYNLGLTGAKMWVAAGRPSLWQPPYADKPRNVAGYITRITEGAESYT